jgi:hypothetical protein
MVTIHADKGYLRLFIGGRGGAVDAFLLFTIYNACFLNKFH